MGAVATVRQNGAVLWPVLVDAEPMSPPWKIGDQVSGMLAWVDEPLARISVVHDVEFAARPLFRDETLVGQLLSRGSLTVLRCNHAEEGVLRLNGCLAYDRYMCQEAACCRPSASYARCGRSPSYTIAARTGGYADQVWCGHASCPTRRWSIYATSRRGQLAICASSPRASICASSGICYPPSSGKPSGSWSNWKSPDITGRQQHRAGRRPRPTRVGFQPTAVNMSRR